MLIYDIPAFTGSKLENDTILSLAGHGNVIGMKDSSTDLERFQNLLALLENNADFFLFQGMENLALHRRGVCENIMLDHEGTCPKWLAQKTKQVFDLVQKGLEICKT